MDFKWDRIDLIRTFAAGEEKPAMVLPRRHGERWLVAESGIYIDRPTQWTFFQTEDSILVPLIPYLLHPDPDLAFAHMFAIGMKCLISEVKRPVKRLHVVTGVPLDELDDTGDGPKLRYWFGFAVLT
jgi:hypothetical protein